VFKVVYEGIKKARFFLTVQLKRNVASISKGGGIQVYSKLENITKQLVAPQGNYNSPSVFYFRDFGKVPAFFNFFSTNNFQAVPNHFISKLHLSQKKGF